MASSLVYAYLLLGVALGARRPGLGLRLLVGLVAVTPSLPWQLGLPNLAYPLFYSVGLIAGSRLTAGARLLPPIAGTDWSRTARRVGSSPVLLKAALATVGCIVLASILALLRNNPVGYPGFATELASGIRTLPVFDPGGLAGFLQAMLIPVVGVSLFIMALTNLREARDRDRFQRALVGGALLTAASPVLQLTLLDPTVRPDKRLEDGAGLVGFFQDPHSLAGYLVLTIGVLLGIASRQRLRRNTSAGWAVSALVVALGVVLLFTNSRSGLVAAAICVATFVLAHWGLGPTNRNVRRRRLRVIGACAVGVALITAAAVASIQVRGALYNGLASLGNARMWEVLDPEGPEHPLLARRVLQWQKATQMISDRPIWGAGPQGYVEAGFETPELSRLLEEFGTRYGAYELRMAITDLPVENAHNYFLQHATEFGLPALAALCALLGLVLAATMRGLRGAASPETALLTGLLAGQLGFLALCAVSHPLLLAEMQMVFWTVAALSVATAAARAPVDDSGVGVPW